MQAAFSVRTDPTADDSFADILAPIRFGMAMAAIIRMMATTTSSSISENPFCLFRIFRLVLRSSVFLSFVLWDSLSTCLQYRVEEKKTRWSIGINLGRAPVLCQSG